MNRFCVSRILKRRGSNDLTACVHGINMSMCSVAAALRSVNIFEQYKRYCKLICIDECSWL